MAKSVSRRQFLWQSSAAGIGWFWMAQAAHSRVLGANERVAVAVMGLSRGLSLARTFEQQPDAQVLYVCDVDRRRTERGIEEVRKIRDRVPEGSY
jgi:hypothetical protein